MWTSLAIFSCSLDTGNKLACHDPSDCNPGFVCVSAQCTRAGEGAAGGGGTGGDAGTMGGAAGSTTGGAASGAAGSAHAGAASASGATSLGGDGGDGGLPSGAGGMAPAAAATLRSLTPSSGKLVPDFDPAVHAYTLDLSLFVPTLSFTATADPGTAITLQSEALASGKPSPFYALQGLAPQLNVTASAPPADTQPYSVTLNRNLNQPRTGYFNSSYSGNFGDVIVIDQDTLVTNAGDSVEVFTLTQGNWVLQATLKPAVTELADGFGRSLALSGDTLVVGAAFEDSSSQQINGFNWDNSQESSGAAYVFERTGATWTETTYLKSSKAAAGHQFGSCVAILGDTIAVGAIREDGGAAYVFQRSGDTWLEQGRVKGSHIGAAVEGNVDSRFGVSLALGTATLLVGAPNELGPTSTGPAEQSGAAYVFSLASGAWSETAHLRPNNPGIYDEFGTSVALQGALMAIGAPAEDGATSGPIPDETDDLGHDSGAVYLFTHSTLGWQQAAYVKATVPAANDLMGCSVALSGDVLVTGAYTQWNRDGSAYVFSLDTLVWAQRARFNSATVRTVLDVSSDGFGIALALGANSLAISAPYEAGPIAGLRRGTIYVFR